MKPANLLPHPRLTLTALALTAAVSVAACGSGDSKGTTAQQTPPPAASTTTTTAATDSGSAGDTLSLGQRAETPYVVYAKTGTSKRETQLGVTVLKVRKGKISDFKGFKLDKQQRATTPYYVDVKLENLGKIPLDRFLLDPSVEDTGGKEYKPINLIVLSGTFKPCPNASRKKLRAGESFTLCAPILLPIGTTLERVRFQGDVTKDPVFWKPGA